MLEGVTSEMLGKAVRVAIAKVCRYADIHIDR